MVSTPSPTRQVALAALLGLGGSGVDDGDGGGGGLAHVSVEPAGGTVRLAVAEGKAGGEGGGGEATGRRGSALEIEWVHEVVLAGEGSGDRGDAGEDSVRTRIRGALVPETATTLVLMPQVITALRLENAPPRMLSPTLRLPSQSADVEGDVETSRWTRRLLRAVRAIRLSIHLLCQFPQRVDAYALLQRYLIAERSLDADDLSLYFVQFHVYIVQAACRWWRIGWLG